MSYEKIAKTLKHNHPESDLDIVKKAYDFAEKCHYGQKRISGDDYISHPIAVAQILADQGLDDITIAAAFLHDTIEDCNVTKIELEKVFNNKIAELVIGVTTLGEIDFSNLPNEDIQEAKFQAEIENLRRFFLAMAQDIRVVIIKMADRLHNMRTLEYLTIADQKRISRETLEIFAPLADRLGMGQIKAELEDLAFKFSNPKDYHRIKGIIEENERERRNYLTQIKRIILIELNNEGIEATIDGRVKHLYSIYKKLNKVNQDISKIYDLMAVRVIVDTVEDCYKSMGIIHKQFKPLIYNIKDYIAVPKPNGYRSLHTTVFGIKGRITEIQIRTQEMHDEAEMGIAAHWHYDETKLKAAYKGQVTDAPIERLNWVNKLATWQRSVGSGKELAEELKIDMFNDRIFVFSPKGNIFDLPEGATPVDFAYEVHSNIGHRCRGAKVNGRIVPLEYQLKNRDVIDVILASKNDQTGPKRGWLEFVKTARAKQRIRAWFKKVNWEENRDAGQKLFYEELQLLSIEPSVIDEAQKNRILDETNWHNWDDLMAAIGEGTITAKQIVKKVSGPKSYINEEKLVEKIHNLEKNKPEFSNWEGVLIRYADCCKPKKGDKIKGFITQGQGITIHKADCNSLLTSPSERIIDVDFNQSTKIEIKVKILGDNRVGLVRDITDLIAKEKIIIDKLKADNPTPEISQVSLAFSVDNSESIPDIFRKINKMEGIRSVKRM